MRTRLPALRTLPSRTALTPSFLPISRTSLFFPLKAKDDVLAVTWRPSTRVSALMSSSEMPSLKNSFSGSALMLTKGSTAMVLSGGPVRAAIDSGSGTTSPGAVIAKTRTGRRTFFRSN